MRAIVFLLVLLSATLYGFALTQPAFVSGNATYSGWDCLKWIPFEIAAWYANPLLFVSWIILACRHWSGTLFAAGALALAISFTGLTPSRGDINELRAGYWLWMASITVALLTGILAAVTSVIEESRRTRESLSG